MSSLWDTVPALQYAKSAAEEKEAKKPLTEPSIKAYIGRGRNTITEQADWPESIKCPKCKGTADLMLVVSDPRGKISDSAPKGLKRGDTWPHDSMAIAHYFCTKCGEIQAKWNQA